jgi:hypothetical protein
MIFAITSMLTWMEVGGDGSNSKEKALFADDISKVESFPITWEIQAVSIHPFYD